VSAPPLREKRKRNPGQKAGQKTGKSPDIQPDKPPDSAAILADKIADTDTAKSTRTEADTFPQIQSKS
jgi:hypothetical protein